MKNPSAGIFSAIPFCTVALRGIKNLLSDTKALWRNLQKLIRIDEFQTLLQTHDLRRRKL